MADRGVRLDWATPRVEGIWFVLPAGSDDPAANLLFVTGCGRIEDGKWYRLLRHDGTMILKGTSPFI